MGFEIRVDSPFVGHRHFLRSDGVSFWGYLQKNRIAFEKRHFPFLTNGRLPEVRTMFDFDDYVKLRSKGEALAYLYSGLGKTLNYVGPVLDLELPHGFNDHTDRHTLWVSQTGVELLQRAGSSFGTLDERFGSDSEVLMTLAGMMHDLGNLVDRKDHSTYSAWLLTRLFGKTKKHRKEWEAVLYAILFHEEPVLKSMGIDLSQGIPLQWALVAADKMHVGRDRIGGRSFDPRVSNTAFEEDIHILLEAFIVRSTWFMRNNVFVWHLGFSVDQLEDKFGAFSRGNDRLWVPKFFQRMFRSGVKYRDTFANEFNRVYGDRMKMAAASVFLLYSYIDTFQVRLADIDTRGKVGSQESVIWETKRTNSSGVRNGKRDARGWWMRG